MKIMAQKPTHVALKAKLERALEKTFVEETVHWQKPAVTKKNEKKATS